MSDDFNKQLNIKLNLDANGFKKAQRALEDLTRREKFLKDNALVLNKEFQTTEKRLIAVGKEAAKLERARALEQLGADAANSNQELRELQNYLVSVGGSASDVSKVTSAFNKQTKAIELTNNQLKLNDNLNDDLRRNIGITGDVDTGFQTLAGGTRAIGLQGTGLEVGLGLAGDVFAVSEGLGQLQAASKVLIPSLKENIKLIGASGFGLIGAMAALAIVTKVLGDRFSKERERTETYLNAQRDLIEARRTLSEDELNQRRDENAQRIAIDEEFFSKLVDAKRDTDALIEAGGTFAEASRTILQPLGLMYGSLEGLENVLSETEIRLGEAYTLQDGYNSLVGDANILQNTRNQQLEEEAAKLQALNDAQADIALSYLNFIGDTDVTKAQVQERIDQLNQEQQAIQQVLQIQGLSAEKVAQLNEQYSANSIQLDLLTNRGLALAESYDNERTSKEALITATEQQFSKLTDLVSNFNALGANLQAASDDISKARDKASGELDKIANDLDKKEGEINSKLNDALVKAFDTFEDATTKATKKANEDREKVVADNAKALLDLEQDLADKRKEINLKANAELSNAIATRDAVAALTASRNRDSALSDLENDQTKQETAIANKLNEATAQIDKSLSEQLANAQDNYNKQKEAARSAASEQLDATRQNAQERTNAIIEGFNKEREARQAALQEQLSDLFNFNQQGQGLIQQFTSGALSTMGNLNNVFNPGSVTNPFNNNGLTSNFAPVISPSLNINNVSGNGGLSPAQVNQVQQLADSKIGQLLQGAIRVSGAYISGNN